MNIPLYPFRFTPIYKNLVWGGDRIPKKFNRDLPPGVYAESWEISCREDGMSVVKNGALKGLPLSSLLQRAPKEILGSRAQGSDFPLLFKIIDARECLSVQVHPNIKNAKEQGTEPKTEAWCFLGETSSKIWCGLKKGARKTDFSAPITSETIQKTLREIEVQNGEIVFVPGGRIHAIGRGALLYEVQQNSNTTYRIYDWDRLGHDGKPRQLHTEEALQTIDWEDQEDPIIQPKQISTESDSTCFEVLCCPFFRLEKILLSGTLETPLSGESFHVLFVAEGSARIEWKEGAEQIDMGTSLLIPAGLGTYRLSGEATLLRTSIPEEVEQGNGVSPSISN